MRYHQGYDGEWIQPKRKNYYMQCCDCGLSHRIDFKLIKDKLGRARIQYRAFRIKSRKKKERK